MILPPSNHARVASTNEAECWRSRRGGGGGGGGGGRRCRREDCPFEGDRCRRMLLGLFFALSPSLSTGAFAGFRAGLDDVRAQYLWTSEVAPGARAPSSSGTSTRVRRGPPACHLNGNSLLDLAEEGSNYMEGSPRYIRIGGSMNINVITIKLSVFIKIICIENRYHKSEISTEIELWRCAGYSYIVWAKIPVLLCTSRSLARSTLPIRPNYTIQKAKKPSI